MGKLGVQDALKHARQHQARYLDGFKTLLRFPSVSLEAGKQPLLLDCANWILREMRRAGLRNCQLLPTAGNPAVYADWLAAGDGAPTILFYAHYDVQPAGDASLWESTPFEPTISDGRLVARGAIDDKCGVWVNLKAIDSALSAVGELPINVKLFFEGEEEIGSVNTAAVLSDYRSILSADAVIISDGPFSPPQPSIGYALRGSISGEVRVAGPPHDLHSGRYGGAVKNPIHFLARIISSIHDASGRVRIKGFYDDIIPMSHRQIRHLNELWKTSGPELQRAAGVDVFFGDYLGVFAERTTSQPTLDVGGITGGHQGGGARAIIPAEASCKVTIRHVPGQDSDAMWTRFVDHVMAFEEPGISIATEMFSVAHPFLMPDDGREIRAIQRAVKTVLDKEALLMRHGGSLAIGGLLARELNAPVTMFGYGSGSNSHAPNEFIYLDDLHDATEVAIHLLFELAEKKGSQFMKTMSFDFKSRRSMVSARRGMVGASNPLAAQAGLNILRRGGNAADAAVATSAMMNVMDPASCGVGGDCFALYFDAGTKQVTALNGSGRAPGALTLETVKKLGWATMPRNHAHSVTVPGAVRGWHDLLQRHGTMTLADVLGEAIYYASEGYPTAPVVGHRWALAGEFLRNAANADEYLPDGAPPRAGQVARLPGLANTLQAIAEGGPDAFYSGPIAEAIVSSLQEQGGVMTLDDLKNHHSTWDEPIHTDYHGITVYECPPNGQGLTALIALNIAENFDLKSLPWDSPERIHLMVECMRLAWADAHEYIADISRADVPVDELLGKDFAEKRAALIHPYYAADPPRPAGELPGGSDTIYLSVVDGAGNACSFIKSLYMGYGVGIVARGTGVWLQNRGAGFSLVPGHRNALAPGKRPYHTIIPGMALKQGELWASFGVMGGFMQPQGHFQVISGMVDDDLNPQEALNRPRWMIANGDPAGSLLIEEGGPFKTMADLAERGHRIQPETGLGRGIFGRGQIIRYDAETGVMHGGSEPRADGQIAAF